MKWFNINGINFKNEWTFVEDWINVPYEFSPSVKKKCRGQENKPLFRDTLTPKYTGPVCASATLSPVTVWAFPSVFKSGATGCLWENPLSTLWDDGFMPFSITPLFHPPSLSHDKVGDELSHPSALWVPVCLWRGNKVSVLLLQNGVSQSKWWEIGQQSAVEGQRRTLFFGCIVGLINNMRRNPSFLQSIFHLRTWP